MLEEHADQNEVSTLYRGARPGSQNGQREQRWRRKNTQPMTDTVTSFCSAIIIIFFIFLSPSSRRLAGLGDCMYYTHGARKVSVAKKKKEKGTDYTHEKLMKMRTNKVLFPTVSDSLLV